MISTPKRWMLSAIFISALACHHDQDNSITAGVDDPVTLRRRVTALIPIGTPLDSAVQRLAREGFVCPVPEQRPGPPWTRGCSKSRRGISVILSFDVSLISRDTFKLAGSPARPPRVDSIAVRTGLTGP